MGPTTKWNPRGSAALGLAACLLCAGGAAAAPAGSPWGEHYFPDVALVTHEGKTVRFYDELIRDKRVVVAFVYTRCTRICGLMTAKLVQVQRELGGRVGKDIFFYSISLDPERDTPASLARYARAFQAPWTFLTGRKEDIALLRRKFGDLGDIEDHSAKVSIGNDATGQWWTTSSLDNPRYLATLIADWMDPAQTGSSLGLPGYAEARRPAAPDQGHQLFQERCVACHPAQGEGVGPDLRGVLARRERAWLERWLAAPEKVLAARDPVALALLEAAGGIPMPNLGLSREDIEHLLRYLGRMETERAGAPAP